MPCACNLSGFELASHLEKASGQERIPLQCQWEITCRCNLKCVMCYTDCFNTPAHITKELSLDEIKRIMDEMKEAGVLELTLTGGEPMARPDFKQIYGHAIQSGFLTSVFTNGTYINEEWIEVFKDYPPTMIEISYHGAKAETFDGITQQKGSFAKVNRAIQLLLQAGIPLTLKATGLTVNESEILEIKRYARSFEKVFFRYGQVIRPLLDGNQTSKAYQLPQNQLDAIIDDDPELSADQQRQESLLEASQTGCHEGKKRFHIDAYGFLQLCSENRKEGYNLRIGNFKEGFYEKLPFFPCPMKQTGANVVLSSSKL